MNCYNCKNWSTDYDLHYCVVCSTKPHTTGNPSNCPYFKAK